MENDFLQCEKCSSKNSQTKHILGHRLCPLCLKITFLENLTDILKCENDSEFSIKCSICGSFHKSNAKEIISQCNSQELIPKICNIHTDEEITGFCITCDKFICLICYEKDHNKHLINIDNTAYCYRHATDADDDNKCIMYCKKCELPLCEECSKEHSDCDIIAINVYQEEKEVKLLQFISKFDGSSVERLVDYFRNKTAECTETTNYLNQMVVILNSIMMNKLPGYYESLVKNLKENSKFIKKCSEQVSGFMSNKCSLKDGVGKIELKEDKYLDEISVEVSKIKESIEKIVKLCQGKVFI
jgi:hypothetical protein